MKSTIKKIYKALPFKKEIFTVMKTIWKPSERIYRHLHFTGVIKVKAGKSKSFKMKHYGYQVENEMFWVGLTNGWEKESLKLWLKLCTKSEVIFDLGANTGIYSLVAKTIAPDAKVFAFEPVKRIYKKLRENIDLNGYDVVAVEKAVSDKDGTAVIYDTSTEHIYAVTVNKNLSSPDEKVVETTIETVTLDSFIRENNLKKVDLMKIDVETHEPEVLAGFLTYLPQYKPTMLIEILNDEVGARVHSMVKDLGYLYFNIDERGSIRQVDKITKSDYYNYLLCNRDTAIELGLINKNNP
ncbi:MAG: FkbM family methyltransferase [Bacteroidota bacterium]|nr:FkbM family methyltransferase [Bacteroidota bacterium]